MSWWRRLLHRGRMDQELDAELRFHFDLQVAENIRSGMSGDEARRSARLNFGGLEQIKEDCRESRGTMWVESILQDVRFALRQLRRAPGFAIVTMLALSLGIGTAAAVFSVMDAVLLRPLPFSHQDRLVVPEMTSRAGLPRAYSYPSYLDLRARLQTFDTLAAYAGGVDNANLEAPAGPVSLRVIKGTDNFFAVFGVKPILGRTYLSGEDQAGKDDIAVLSYEVWRTYFAGQADAVGKTVRLGGTPYTVIGVMPAGFRFPLSARNVIYTPLHPKDSWRNNRGPHWMRVVGLEKEGLSSDRTLADFNRVLSDIGRAYPDTDGGLTASLIPLADQANRLDSGNKVSGPLGTLALACLALLGIACVNVAGLLLARGVKREREMALRAAVGANRSRLVRQMLSESIALCVFGLAGGMLVSWLLLKVMSIFLVTAMARGADVHLNVTVATVALGLSLVTSILASLAPAVRLSGTDPNRALRAGGAGASSGRDQHRLRSILVVTQVALSLVLLVVSALLLRNLRDSLKTNLGFNPSTILATEIDLSPGRYEGRDPVTSFYHPLLERVSHLPGVEGAGVIDNLPVQSWGSSELVHIAGQPPDPPNQEMQAEIRFVSAGYFDAMGIKPTGGRMLSPELDRADVHAAGTAIVNEAFRRKFFANGGTPVGARLDDNPNANLKTAIVGVVTDVRQDLQEVPMAEIDWLIDALPEAQRLDYLGNMMLVVRSSGNLPALVPSLRSAFHEVDPTVPFKTPETMTHVVSEQLIFERMESWLFGIFASFALLLAMVGLYGLVSHEVELRTKEIGIRMALGSTRSLAANQVLRRLAVLMGTGTSLGLLLTLLLKKILSSVVAMHPGHDLALLVGVAAGLTAMGLFASVSPARRAASIEPIQALRAE